MPSTKTLRTLVIGAGPAAEALHLPVLARLRDRGELELTLVCDIDHKRAAAARAKYRFLDDCGDAITGLRRGDIDVVYIFGSAQLHYEYGLAALREGKHLFVEKPIAPSYEQACEIADVARALRLVAVGGHNRRFYKSLVAVHARAGKSRWRFAEAVFHKPDFETPAPFGARSWLSANGIHALDALLFMMGGLPEKMTAQIGTPNKEESKNFAAVMQWADGSQGVFLSNNSAGTRREEYTFHGVGETCTISEKGLTIERPGFSESKAYPFVGDGIAEEHDAFLHAINGGTEPPHSIATLAPSLYLSELIEEGFDGAVELPRTAAQFRNPIGGLNGTILVAPCVELNEPLATLLPGFRIVSLKDVAASEGPHDQVVAAILGRGSSPLALEVLDKLPKLEIVGVMGLSLARFAPEALLARGIKVVNASQSYAESVAEFALALAILGRRRAFVSHELMRDGGWGVHPRPVGAKHLAAKFGRSLRPALKALRLESIALRLWHAFRQSSGASGRRVPIEPSELRGATVGLIGWSFNAQAFARRLISMDARVLVYSEHAGRADIEAAGAKLVSLAEVLAADVVSLHRGLTKDTLHFLGAPELERLRAGAVIINIARGALIEPNALLTRLQRGDIVACLDTYDEEPLPAEDPLRNLSNVFLTSHIAGGSMDMHAAAAAEVVCKVATYLAGDVVDSISTERLRTMT